MKKLIFMLTLLASFALATKSFAHASINNDTRKPIIDEESWSSGGNDEDGDINGNRVKYESCIDEGKSINCIGEDGEEYIIDLSENKEERIRIDDCMNGNGDNEILKLCARGGFYDTFHFSEGKWIEFVTCKSEDYCETEDGYVVNPQLEGAPIIRRDIPDREISSDEETSSGTEATSNQNLKNRPFTPAEAAAITKNRNKNTVTINF